MILAGCVLADAAGAPGYDGPTKRPDWLSRVSAEPIRGGAVGADEWKGAGGEVDGGAGAPQGFRARGVTLLSWLPLNALPGDSEAGADCWGYTSPSGREYAIMCVHNGTGFIEVTDPANPVVVGFVGGAPSLWHDPTPWRTGARPSQLGARFSSDATVIGEYCYACSDVAGGYGIQIIDLRGIDDGVVRHVKNWTAGGMLSVETLAGDAGAGRLFACGSNIANGGLVCVDATDPENLVLAGAWTTQRVQDAQAVTYPGGPHAGREIVFCFAGGASRDGAGGLAVVDATDPADMRTLSMLSYPGIALGRQGWTTPDRRYLYGGEGPDGPGDGVRSPATGVFDIADLSNPRYVGRFATPGGTAGAYRQYVAGDVLYQSSGTAGLRVSDVSDPAAPEEFAFFDTFPEHDEPKDQGAWGNYPFFKSGTVLISDMQRGLFVVRVDCRADLDRDGVVSPMDLVALVNFFGAEDPRSDINGDSALDLCDFLEFQELFRRGCG